VFHLSRFPRRIYTRSATPLEPLPRLTERYGGPHLWIKRDDQLGLLGGGNKTRKLEFLMAEALAQGADTVITTGAVQSNHCRLTLSAAALEGLKGWLLLEERVPGSYLPEGVGNHLLFRLLGAEEIRVVPAGTDLVAGMEDLARELRAAGRRPYIIPGGGSNPLGALGYAACGFELLQQAFQQNLSLDHLVCASGSGGTHAGLLAAVTAAGVGIPVTGISVRSAAGPQIEKIRALTEATLDQMGAPVNLPPDAVRVVDTQVGAGYSLPTDAMIRAVQLLATTEGILLDPVYTGKAMAGFLELIESGAFAPGEKVAFLHTGGAPSLSAFAGPFFDRLPGA